MAGASTETIHDVVCGFCGLGCDDLSVEVEGRDVRAKGTICPEAARLLRRLDVPDRPASVAGAPVSLDEAAAAARRILTEARAPVIGGLGTDMAGAGALVDLAIRFGGVLDHYASDGLFRNYAATQRTGWLSTTLAEVRNRCDVLVVVGDDPSAVWGRLFERFFPETPLFADQGRKVVFLGSAPGEKAKAHLARAKVFHHAASDAVAALEALGSFVAGRQPPGESFGGIAANALAGLAEELRSAHYAVVTWNAAEIDDGDLVAERATALVDALNVTTRAGVFPLGGRDNIIGVNQLMLWRIGYPLRTAIRGQESAHDGVLYASEAALADADVLVWVSAFRPEPPPAFTGKVIALAHPETVFEKEPDVLIPVGTPGVDHAGTVFRMDSIVSLPLGALRVATLPSVAEAVRRIAEG
ncbi:formylmethanofuran dehydrogenase [Starkeya sp. 3C]|uniref:Formylmethanofuran dehydrogenase n=1 Tax=Ancylobacter moscoviensis TaxID=2597768 RepID=A0ABY3DQV5_9HYPH|nr:formylmethanofuran dehydrogenase [Ancylobacter moscoviensis]TSJ62195.1 formylmethanofuran dehydrogenase [Ancylobacter moscoviensis]